MTNIKRLKELIINDPVLRIFANQASRRNLKAYLIGGYVRDALLGKNPKDIDLMVEGSGYSETIGNLIAEKFSSTLVQFKKHMIVYRITIENRQYDFADLNDKSISEDQLRRDFPINSLAIEITSLVQNPEPSINDILDANHGLDDLSEKLIRINSESVLQDDPLRIIRMFRFESQLGFNIEPDSLKTAKLYLSSIKTISGERVRDELFHILRHPNAVGTLEKMDSAGVLGILFPKLQETKGVTQNDFHHLDVFEHTLCAVREFENLLDFTDTITSPYRDDLVSIMKFELVDERPRFALMKLALLFHDIGKPDTRVVNEDGKVTFIGHDKLGVEIIEPYLEYLHLSKRETKYVTTLIEGHLRPGFLDSNIASMPKAIFRYFDKFGEYGVDLVLMSLADRRAAQGVKVDDEINERHDRIASILLDAYFNRTKILIRPPTLVDGNDLMRELNLPAGRRVGILLKIIQEGQASGEVGTYDDAIEYARKFMHQAEDEIRESTEPKSSDTETQIYPD